MVNDPDDRDPADATGPMRPVDPWVHDAETVMHRPVTGPDQDHAADPGATQVNRPIDATAVGGTPVDPPHWVARANVNPQRPRSSLPQAWEEDPAREDDPYGGRSWFTPVIVAVVGLVLLFAVGVGVFLIYRNSGKTAQPQPSSSVVSAAPTTTGPAPTSAAPTSVAPSSAEPSTSGPAIAVIPTLRGATQQGATNQLKALGFTVNVIMIDDPTVAPGTVSHTDPAEGTPATTGSTITIFVSKRPAEQSPSTSAKPSASASNH
jgi:hypothetical protein